MPIDLSTSPVNPLTASVNSFWARIQIEFNRLNNLLNDGSNLVWKNPGAVPHQVVAAFGANAASLFQLSALLCGLIGSITGTTPNPVPAGWTVTANRDGTVTLTPPANPR
ncbi:MAG: hypothetical protein ABSB74_06795 [Tepidisphaeraceae bacterium]